MKYELAKIEREIRPDNIWNAFNGRPSRKVSKTNLSEINEVFNVPLTQLILYQSILIKYNDLFIDEEFRITQSLKDYQINNTGESNKYIVVNYKGLLNLHNDEDTITPQKSIETNLPLIDIKKLVFKQINYDLQIKFVLPLKYIFETDFKEILINIGYLESQERVFLVAIKANNISITELEINQPLNFQHIHSETLNRCFRLNYNSCNSPYEYQKYLEQLYDAFKQTVRSRFSISNKQLTDLEKLHEIKSIISEILNRFQLVNNTQTYLKTDSIINLKQEVFSLSLQDKVAEFQSILQDYLSIQYQFSKDALAFIENRIELLKYTIETRNINSTSDNTDSSSLLHNKIKTKLSVPQLAYLFRCLVDEKGILNEKNKASLFRKISAGYISTRQDNISPGSISNKFSMPDPNAIDFWDEKFTHLKQLARNDAEMYGA